jgi:hypothetical protein
VLATRKSFSGTMMPSRMERIIGGQYGRKFLKPHEMAFTYDSY